MKHPGFWTCQAAIVLLALFALFYGYMFADALTVRNIPAPAGEFTVAFPTHGGVVYITEREQLIQTCLRLAVVPLLFAQAVLSWFRSRPGQRQRRP